MLEIQFQLVTDAHYDPGYLEVCTVLQVIDIYTLFCRKVAEQAEQLKKAQAKYTNGAKR